MVEDWVGLYTNESDKFVYFHVTMWAEVRNNNTPDHHHLCHHPSQLRFPQQWQLPNSRWIGMYEAGREKIYESQCRRLSPRTTVAAVVICSTWLCLLIELPSTVNLTLTVLWKIELASVASRVTFPHCCADVQKISSVGSKINTHKAVEKNTSCYRMQCKPCHTVNFLKYLQQNLHIIKNSVISIFSNKWSFKIR